jgi:hypothetical protein
LVSQRAGVAGDLVRDGENGRVLPLEAAVWAEVAASLLTDASQWERMSASALRAVVPYTYANAAEGLALALALAGTPRSDASHHG